MKRIELTEEDFDTDESKEDMMKDRMEDMKDKKNGKGMLSITDHVIEEVICVNRLLN